MKNSVSKKEIGESLRSLDRTIIFRIAKISGVDVSKKSKVYDFIIDNAPNKKVRDAAYNIALYATNYKEFKFGYVPDNTPPILQVINWAKTQKKEGWMHTNHGKILIEGNTNIYWAHPGYQHSDYNKSRAMPNNEKNRRVADVINRFLKS